MKKRKIAAGCVSIVLLASFVAGCGDSRKDRSPSTEAAPVSPEIMDQALSGTDEQNSNSNKDSEEDSGADHSADDAGKEVEELIGSVKTIEKNSLVISQAVEVGEDMIMEPAEGSPDEVLVSVNISESTLYEVKTVKNSGVNGDADVETRTGTFSDLKEGVSVNISGYYEGEIFRAEKIGIMLFV